MNPVSQLSRRFRVAFDDHKTVPNAGLVIPLRLADQLGIPQAINRRVRGVDRKSRPNSGAKALNLVAMLIAGGDFISDIGILTAGSTLTRLGYHRFSASRLGEWLRSLTSNDIAGLADTLTEATATAWSIGLGPDLNRTPQNPLIVDLDSTHIETYGTAKHGTETRNYQGLNGYYPLLAIEASTSHVIAAKLRAGNASPANGTADFAADTIRRLRSLTDPVTSLLLRADSGFYLKALFDHCVATDTRFSVTVRQHRPIRNLIAGIQPNQWQPVTNPTNTNHHIAIADIAFQIKGRTTSPVTDPVTCRLIVRRTTTPADTGKPQPRLFDLVDHYAFVTDQTGDPETLWHRHNHRAVIETAIRDLKHNLGLNHLPSGSFTANQAWLHLNTLAHNICRFTNHLITPTPLTTKTLRYRYLTIPGRITKTARTTTLHLPAHWPWHHHITTALTTLHHPQPT